MGWALGWAKGPKQILGTGLGKGSGKGPGQVLGEGLGKDLNDKVLEIVFPLRTEVPPGWVRTPPGSGTIWDSFRGHEL